MLIKPGELVQVVTASGATALMRALSGPATGRDFPVVWVCTQEEYEDALADNVDLEDVDGIPWPLDAVVQVAADDTQVSA